MEIKQYGSYYLRDNPQLYEPMRGSTFQFVVPELNNILRSGAEEGEVDSTITNADQVFRFSVDSTSVPHFSQETISIKRGNSTMKFAGAPSFPDGNIVINDYIGADSKSVLMAWQNKSYNVKEEAVGLASDYKLQGYLMEYTPDFKKLVRTWKLIGCWISGLNEDNFSASSDGKRTITATIQYDYAVMEMPD